MFDMRENALPILEKYGVDLVLSGHSHSYERSFLLRGHFGTSGTLTSAMILDSGNGRTSGDGAYDKSPTGNGTNGTVYTVAGSSGKVGTVFPVKHPAMYNLRQILGSVIIDIDGSQLDAIFLDNQGAVQDTFSIVKAVNVPPVATNDTSVVLEAGSVNIDVLANDTDII